MSCYVNIKNREIGGKQKRKNFNLAKIAKVMPLYSTGHHTKAVSFQFTLILLILCSLFYSFTATSYAVL